MAKRLFDYLNIPLQQSGARSKDILLVNPTNIAERIESPEIKITVYDYNQDEVTGYQLNHSDECLQFRDNAKISWLNIDGIKKSELELITQYYGIHPLLLEDILSVGQRPKMDEVEDVLFCQLNMLYYNEQKHLLESEQISIALGKGFVISIQEDASRDVFDPLRKRLGLANSKIRQRQADYLLYSMLDLIVDNYFVVMEKFALLIETLEEEVIKYSHEQTLNYLNSMRKELIILQRNITPVRDLIAGLLRSESPLLEDRNTKYFKDIYDHITQAFELSENCRDMIVGIQDLYINNVNLKLNEVMKFIAVVTCLMAPATVIGGIFGMNFEVIPYTHKAWGFYAAIISMVVIPIIMLIVFKKRRWF